MKKYSIFVICIIAVLIFGGCSSEPEYRHEYKVDAIERPETAIVKKDPVKNEITDRMKPGTDDASTAIGSLFAKGSTAGVIVVLSVLTLGVVVCLLLIIKKRRKELNDHTYPDRGREE